MGCISKRALNAHNQFTVVLHARGFFGFSLRVRRTVERGREGCKKRLDPIRKSGRARRPVSQALSRPVVFNVMITAVGALLAGGATAWIGPSILPLATRPLAAPAIRRPAQMQLQFDPMVEMASTNKFCSFSNPDPTFINSAS